MTESERLKLHIWSLHESRDGADMAEFRHMIAGMVTQESGFYALYNRQASLASPYAGSQQSLSATGQGLWNFLGFGLYR